MDPNRKADYTIKVILLGSSGVGKTSIVSSYLDSSFEPQTVPTVAPASCSSTVDLDGKRIELAIWDTAGQERFQSISQMFYRDSHVALICFEPNKHENCKDWISRVKAESPDCIIILVATKADTLSTNQMLSLNQSLNDLRDDIGAKLSFITSSKTGQGIKDVFECAAGLYREIYQTNQPEQTQRPIPVPSSHNKKCC